jgi:hypothetical protein
MPSPEPPDPNTGQGKEQLRFSLRVGKIHEVEAMPFVTIPYGLGDGWTEGSGR